MSVHGNTLRRSMVNRQVAGVCAGLGEYFAIDPTVVRVAFAIGFVLGMSATFWIYVVMWLVVPEREYY